jgi:hypothetical protein
MLGLAAERLALDSDGRQAAPTGQDEHCRQDQRGHRDQQQS